MNKLLYRVEIQQLGLLFGCFSNNGLINLVKNLLSSFKQDLAKCKQCQTYKRNQNDIVLTNSQSSAQ